MTRWLSSAGVRANAERQSQTPARILTRWAEPDACRAAFQGMLSVRWAEPDACRCLSEEAVSSRVFLPCRMLVQGRGLPRASSRSGHPEMSATSGVCACVRMRLPGWCAWQCVFPECRCACVCVTTAQVSHSRASCRGGPCSVSAQRPCEGFVEASLRHRSGKDVHAARARTSETGAAETGGSLGG